MPQKSNKVLRRCLYCTAPFWAAHAEVMAGKGKYCSQAHFRAHRYGATLEERFWMHTLIGPGCWEWDGVIANGYGLMRENGKHIYAHRFSFEIHFAAIPAGLQVLHDCPDGDNRRCVRPEHLWLGTQGDNVRDCHQKGRAVIPARFVSGERRGEKHPGAKLTDADALAIRARYAAGGVTYFALADLYGVSCAMIGNIVKRRYWKHLP